MHIRLPRWPTVDFRPGRELTLALPLCANSRTKILAPVLPFLPLPPPRDFVLCLALVTRSLCSFASSLFPANFSLVSIRASVHRRARGVSPVKSSKSARIHRAYRDSYLMLLLPVSSPRILISLKKEERKKKWRGPVYARGGR